MKKKKKEKPIPEETTRTRVTELQQILAQVSSGTQNKILNSACEDE